MRSPREKKGTDCLKPRLPNAYLWNTQALIQQDQFISAPRRMRSLETHSPEFFEREDTTCGPISILMTPDDRSPRWPMATSYLDSPNRGVRLTNSLGEYTRSRQL